MDRPNRRRVVALAMLAMCTAAVGRLAPAQADDDVTEIGRFRSPFFEQRYANAVDPATGERPHGDTTGTNPLRAQSDFCRPDGTADDYDYDRDGVPEQVPEEHDGRLDCAPAAGSLAVLEGGDVTYFNALEASEDLEFSIANEIGETFVNDQARVLRNPTDDATRRWELTDPVRADVDDETGDETELTPLGTAATSHQNSSALFCADLDFLPTGELLVIGGTDYYLDPAFGEVEGTTYGVGELAGLRQARVFDPKAAMWHAVGRMTYGRWYPSSVTLGDTSKMVFSGVQKLLKPVYTDQQPENSGRNVVQPERFVWNGFDDARAPHGEFQSFDASADRSLPLFPRVHLLPNGHVLYNAAGQVFNPFGQAYDEALWNVAATFDAGTGTWFDLGVPGIDLGAGQVTSAPGFRGSTFSIMLPLEADGDGGFSKARFLTAGGVLGVTPGSYVATDQSQITTIDIGADGRESMSVTETGSLNQPRWYGTGVLLPDSSVMVFSGANRDEVAGPGTGEPIATAERFDPSTNTWSKMATASRLRTYHNTAALLPDGSVLVGGHAPITTLYGWHQNLPGMSPNEGRDPTFEIYEPPYMFRDRPVVDAGTARQIVRPGQQITARFESGPAITDALLVRSTSITHLVDGDQRAIRLDVTASGSSLSVDVPSSTNVVPAGPYLLFFRTADGTPSVGIEVTVAAP